MTIAERLAQRAALIADARKIIDKCDEEKREASAEESRQFDEMMADADKIQLDVDKRTKLEAAEAGLEESRGTQVGLEAAAPTSETRTIELKPNVRGESRAVVVPVEEQRMKDFRAFLVDGRLEGRDLTKGTDSEGGFLSPPIEFMAELIKTIDDQTFMRQICRVLPPLVNASTLGAPTIATDMSDPAWTTELLVNGEDSALAFGRRDLTPNPLAKWIKVSKTLLRRSTMSADVIVRDRLGYKFGTAQENAYLNGAGTTEPLGVFTADAAGIPVARDVATDNTPTAFTADGLINCQMFVKQQYRRGAVWVMHRDAIKEARKLKDDDGRYIWGPSLIPGNPDMLLGSPLWESEYAPNTFAADQYVAIYGDFSHYWIVDALTLTIQVLIELFATTNQNAYLGRLEADGAPVVGEAFARVQLAPAP